MPTTELSRFGNQTRRFREADTQYPDLALCVDRYRLFSPGWYVGEADTECPQGQADTRYPQYSAAIE
jgi:hypothetical protein